MCVREEREGEKSEKRRGKKPDVLQPSAALRATHKEDGYLTKVKINKHLGLQGARRESAGEGRGECGEGARQREK